jgi:hypothetical protein
MKEKIKENPIKQLERLRMENPKRKGERPGAYKRRLATIQKVENFKAAQQLAALNRRKVAAPLNFWGKFIEVLFLMPFYFVEGLFNRIMDEITVARYAEGKGKLVYFDKDDERKGINGYLQITNDSGAIILLAKLKVLKKVILCLKLKGSKADKAKKFLDTITLCGTGVLVVTAPATITALLLLVPLYLNSDPGNEETTYNNLYNGVMAVMFVYQNYCNTNPTTALTAAAQGGFDVKVQTSRKKQELTAVNNAVQGVVDVTCAGGKGRCSHVWKISYDGVVFEYLSTTMSAHVQVSGLAGGIEVWFLHELITTDGPQGYDLMLKVTVSR